MDYSNKQVELTRKVYYSRMRILSNHPFFGMLVLDMKFRFTNEEKSFSTDGTSISFNPKFLDMLKEEEVDICILHSIMHIVLKHPFREKEYENKELYNLACDIVVNSNILYSLGGFSNKELVVLGQTLPHKVPSGEEGYKYSTKEVYNLLLHGRVEKPKLKETPIITFRSTKSGTIYLRGISVQDYKRNGDWKTRTPMFKKNRTHPLDYPYLKMEQLNHKKEKVELRINDYCETYYLPSYSNNFPSRQFDGIPEGRPNLHEERTYEYYFSRTNKKLIEELSSIEFSNAKIKQEEYEYRQFVKDNYLEVPGDVFEYFSNIASINNFRKEEDNILEKVSSYIKKAARYDLEFIQVPPNKDFILHFLTETKVGLCRHFATACTMFYRTLGIPARYVVGFSGKAKANKWCSVSDKDYHAWVEVYLDNIGWLVIDPTPSDNSRNDKDDDDSDDNETETVLFDGHNEWKERPSSDKREQEINSRILDATELHKNLSKSRGTTPSSIPLIIKELTKSEIDWRVYLQNFIQENIIDYSFCPPDCRFSDLDFILPSFSEPDEEVQNILFMVDVSGSMSDKDVIACFSEIQAAIDQFNGKIQGYVGFFDAKVQGVQKFDGDTKIKDIKPIGRGGTEFNAVFDYVKENMKDDLPNSIIILSDGYCDFPAKEKALGIPVLWVINNKEVNPPWGNVVRIGIED